ncbi:hypothetical protein [Chitinophaga rupis]|nr:hypothetical protein [Chitinophaga rupis]
MNNTFSKKQLMQAIIRVTTEMGMNYPELYTFLDETPLFLSNKMDHEVSSADLTEYFDTLKGQMRNYVRTHSKNISGNYGIARPA